jgi:hypothetical protein
MQEFSATAFYIIGKSLTEARAWNPKFPLDSSAYIAYERALDTQIGSEKRVKFIELLTAVDGRLKEIGLIFSGAALDRLVKSLAPGSPITNREFATQIDNLHERIKDELRTRLFLYMPSGRAEYYQKPDLLGTDVLKKFPALQYDIVEAGNCFATGRSTAVVFHLMRIMETGVQHFGTKLGVPLTNEKAWQAILDGINTAIKPLPKSPQTVEMSTAAANLYAVKLAWRNEVMHPNDTYTLEEAENLIRLVKIFMEQLAKIV